MRVRFFSKSGECCAKLPRIDQVLLAADMFVDHTLVVKEAEPRVLKNAISDP